MLDPEWARAGSRWADPSNWCTLADEFLFHDVLLSARETAYATIRPMRIDAALREPFTFQPGAIPRSLCAVASLDRTVDPAWQRRTWLERGEGQLIGVGAGHCPHISTPRETAAFIMMAAMRAAGIARRLSSSNGARRVARGFHPTQSRK